MLVDQWEGWRQEQGFVQNGERKVASDGMTFQIFGTGHTLGIYLGCLYCEYSY
jgi:hypothetical protein